MANARQEDKSAQGMEDATRRAGEKAAEQTSRIGQAAADETSHAGQAAAEATEEVARASATLLKQNVETLQSAWRFGLETATSVIGRSTEQFGRTLGLSGDTDRGTESRSPSLRLNGSHLPHGDMQQHPCADDGLRAGLAAGGWGSPRRQYSTFTADHPATGKRPSVDLAPSTPQARIAGEVGIQRLAVASSSSTDAGTLCKSSAQLVGDIHRHVVTSRDQPSAVLKATIRAGRLY
jgi:hypothetical protein